MKYYSENANQNKKNKYLAKKLFYQIAPVFKYSAIPIVNKKSRDKEESHNAYCAHTFKKNCGLTKFTIGFPRQLSYVIPYNCHAGYKPYNFNFDISFILSLRHLS